MSLSWDGYLNGGIGEGKMASIKDVVSAATGSQHLFFFNGTTRTNFRFKRKYL